MLDEMQLEKRTNEYWNEHYPDSKNPYEGYGWYIQNLLPYEMEYAGGQNHLPKKKCQNLLLVLLVGHSLEPLLQTVWVYSPTQILLIINQDYGIRAGEAQKNLVTWAIQKILPACEIIARDKPLTEATPAAVFETLLQNENIKSYLRDKHPVIVDITGAKKSMMAGAFLFAAFANVSVSYVDFDDDKYETEKGRPYGYACKIGPFDNPYDKFALRDWERVRELYSRYKFRDARIFLVGEFKDGAYMGGTETILDVMSEYLKSSREPIIKLADILRGYEAWDTGNYGLAKAILDTTPLTTLPSVIKTFGQNWIKIVGTELILPIEIFDDPKKLCIYAHDELARIERIICNDQDYRAAYLRAAGLSEVVMRARLVDLTTGKTRQHLLSIINHTRTDIEAIFFTFTQQVPVPRGKFRIEGWVGDPVVPPERMNQWWEISNNLFSERKLNTQTRKWEEGWQIFIHRRNTLAHTFASIDEKWAWDALAHVRANLGDFVKSQEVSVTVNSDALPWEELCNEEITDLHAYLTPNLSANVKEKSPCQNI